MTTQERLDKLRKELENSPVSLPDIPKLTQADIEEPLTDRQFAFCMYYANGYNGTESATLAGFSKATAKVKASQLLAMLKIRTTIDKMTSGLSKVRAVTKDHIKLKILQLIEQMCCEEKIPYNTIMQALDMFNKMDGNYEQTDPSLTVNLNNIETIEVEIVHKNYDNEQEE